MIKGAGADAFRQFTCRAGAAKSRRMSPRVSVIMIFYNAAEFLGEAIESVLAQDYRDFELLLVDDGSTDAGSAIAESLAEREPTRIRYLHHPDRENRGMSASRNRGIHDAHGELIAFIDADDRWRPQKLCEQVAIFDCFPEVDAACGTVNYWRSWAGGDDNLIPTGHAVGRPIAPPEAMLAMYPLGTADAPCPSDLMVRRTTALALGGFEESFTGALQMYEDQAFLAKLYLERTIYFDERCWLDYRRHDASCVATVSKDGRYDEVRLHFLKWLGAYLAERPALQHPAVMSALNRALIVYQYPRLRQPLRAAGKLVRKITRS
jgi:glycosyltransferase involved in cell wall biosynthesis